MTAPLRVALGQYDTGWHDAAGSLARAEVLVRSAASGGARLVVLPEMSTTGFTMEVADQAEPMDGASVRTLRRIAAEADVHLLAGVAVRECVRGRDRASNTAILFGADGTTRAIYRKQRVFGFAGEDAAYTAGDEPVIADVEGTRIGLFICYDLRFPELFRRVANDVDALVVIANWPASRRAHWDVLLRARAIENQCFVIGVNRTGDAGGLAYDGGSAAFDPWGDPVPSSGSKVSLVEVDRARVRAVREEFPFLRDWRR